MNNTKFTDEFIKQLIDALPHGSGIDCKWRDNLQANGTLVLANSYHCMNDVGYYDGFADFVIKFRPNIPLEDFTLHFSGSTAQYKNKKYMLRDFLEESIVHFIREFEKDISK